MATINFIGILAMTWLFVTGASSIQFIKNFLKVGNTSIPKYLILNIVQKLINCSMCSGFWIGLIYYQDFLMACIVSISAEIFCRVMRVILNKI